MTAVRGHHHSLFGLIQKDGWTAERERELGDSYDHVNVGFQRVQPSFPAGQGQKQKGLDVLDIEFTITLYLYATSKLLWLNIKL